HRGRSARVRRRIATPPTARPGHAACGPYRHLPRVARRAARFRSTETERPGTGIRTAGTEDTALDRPTQLPAHLRAFRPVGYVPLGRPERRSRLYCSHGPRFRTVGGRALAPVHRRGAHRATHAGEL